MSFHALLRQLHWLMAAERIDFKLAVLVYKCQHGAAHSYLADELRQSADCDARRRLRSTSSPFIADCPSYAAVNHRRSSFPGRCCPCLEQFAAPRHVGTISGCLPQSPQDAALRALLSITPFRCCACEVTLVIVGHIDRFFLLTYLHSMTCFFPGARCILTVDV